MQDMIQFLQIAQGHLKSMPVTLPGVRAQKRSGGSKDTQKRRQQRRVSGRPAPMSRRRRHMHRRAHRQRAPPER
eukprot:2993724-Pleurochrysis_carterae.AAC.8